MALLRICHRVAFICNLCFLIGLIILKIRYPLNDGLNSMILVLGFFLSVILNCVVNVWMGILRFSNKPLTGIPHWLIYVNGGFLAIQLILMLK
jgi:hypothetical protein